MEISRTAGRMSNSVAPILDVRKISKSFGGYRAVRDVSLALKRNEKRALIGPNGAGKTTLFNLLSGWLRTDSGEIRYRGEAIETLPAHRICRLGIARTFQITSIYPQLSALANVQVALFARFGHARRLFGDATRADREQALATLQDVDLRDRASTISGELSYGDQKRLELAIALALKPNLLLLDEPTAGIESNTRRQMIELVKRLCADHEMTLLFCEHDMEAVFALADRITVLHQGAVFAEGAPNEIRRDRAVRDIYLGGR
jgi:branched-chain amino acid transport system ATP-binding protein